MASDAHVGDRIPALLQGRLDASQAAEVAKHLASCSACAEERDLLAQGALLLRPLPEVEPRPGFAARVAIAADEARRPAASPFFRWAFGGLAAAAVAAAVVLAVRPQDGGEAGRSQELLLAQRLELYEDLSVMQNREALENLDVVEELDQIPASEVRKP